MTYKRAVSLFSNCGAGDVGYRAAGFRFDVMAELDAKRLKVCLLNHPEAKGVPGDLRETWRSVVKKYRRSAGSQRPALLAACPPCQGMSSARHDRGLAADPDAGSKDERNLLVQVIANVAAALEPSIVVVENVQEFLTRQIRHPITDAGISAARFLIDYLAPHYQVFPILANLCEFGVPQSRKRAFLTFVRRDVPGLRRFLIQGRAPFPRPTHAAEYGGKEPITLAKALKEFDLPKLDAQTEAVAKSSLAGRLHQVPVWGDRRYAMVAAIPANSGRSAWENNQCARCKAVEVGADDALCPFCGDPLLRPVIEVEGKYRLITGFRTSSYRRMLPDRPAPTVTTASGHVGSNFTIHPSENRLLSVLECALLQTFPRTFKWGRALNRYGPTNVRSMIGEAVPPLFTSMHGAVLMEILRNRPGRVVPITSTDRRCENARAKLKLTDPTRAPFAGWRRNLVTSSEQPTSSNSQ